MATRTLSVVFTDIKGFTQRTSSSSRAALRALLDRHEELLLPVIEHYQGTVVKTIGDAFLLTFESPTNAVLCGLMIQETLHEANARSAETDRIEVRVAINTGEVEVRGNDVFGETVNIAARIEGITEAGEVYFTHATYLSMNKAEVPTSEVGERRLKGIDEPIRVYRVIRDENLERYQSLIAAEREGQRADVAAQAQTSRTSLLSKPATKAAVVALAVIAIAAAIFGPSAYQRHNAMRSIDDIEKAIAKVKTRDQETEAFERLNDVADENSHDDLVLYRATLINGAHPYWRRYAFDQIKTLIERDAQRASDPELSEIMFKSLGYLDPDETSPDSRDVSLRAFIAEHYAVRWKDRLLAMIHEPGAGQRINRRNAYLVLETSALRGEVDRFRYFALELWAEVRSNDPWNARTLEFFEAHLTANGRTPDDFELPARDLPEHLRYFNEETDRIVPIVTALFADALKDELLKAVVEEDTGRRLHGWKILEAREWTTPALERSHQLANLNSYWAGYTSGWVVDAMRYFKAQDPATVPDAVRAQVQKIADETAEIVASGKLPDARQTMDDYRERLRVARETLRALG